MIQNNQDSGNSVTYETRVMAVVVVPEGEPVSSEQATRIEIVDEAGGEFVVVTQQGGHTDHAKSLAINPEEWPVLRDAINSMIGACRDTAAV